MKNNEDILYKIKNVCSHSYAHRLYTALKRTVYRTNFITKKKKKKRKRKKKR